MSARKLNRSLLVRTLAVLALLGFGVHLLHGAQTTRHAGVLCEQAEEAQAAADLERASSRWAHYVQLAPHDTEGLANFAALLDESSSNRARRWRAIAVWREVLVREPA